MNKQRCHVVMQTHWDREWYYTFEQYRGRLIELAERIVQGLEKNEFPCFVLDGQVSAIDDLFQVCEESLEEKIRAYLKNGRLIIGPWYVLADEFLINQESMIRNLELGIQKATEYGNCQAIGYLPDTFGHIGQMPQIFSFFDIQRSIIWRGITHAKTEFYWQSPNGSKILTHWLSKGYYLPYLYEENYMDSLSRFFEEAQKLTDSNQLLLSNGGDHLAPATVDYAKRLDEVSSINETVDICFSSYEEFFDALEKDLADPEYYRIVEGELRDNTSCYVLPNVLSTRYELKYENAAIEDTMLGRIEPLCALLFRKEKNPVAKWTQKTWESIILNHPHDSICGCSIDEVHQSMMERFSHIDMDMKMIEERLLTKAGIYSNRMVGDEKNFRRPFQDDRRFLLFNSELTQGGRDVIVDLLFEEEYLEELGYCLQELEEIYIGCKAHTLIGDVVNHKRVQAFDSPLDSFPEFKPRVKIQVQLHAVDLSPLSITAFKLLPYKRDKNTKVLMNTRKGQQGISNAFIQVQLEEQGTLSVYDSIQKKRYTGWNLFYRELDQGDEYNYSQPKNPDYRQAKLDRQSVKISSGHYYQKLEYRLNLIGAKELSASRQGPSTEEEVTEIDVEVILFEGVSTLDFKVKVMNRHKDQRLRVEFPLTTAYKHYYTDSSFELVERKADKKEQFKWSKSHEEVPVVVDPSLSLVYFAEDKFGFYHRGLHEMQVVTDSISRLQVTLLRSVGWLSRSDLNARKIGAGPNECPTPDAQCLGEHQYTYKIDLASHDKNDCLNKSRKYRRPVVKLKGNMYNESDKSLLVLKETNLQISSIRQVEKSGENIVEVRLWNATEEKQKNQLYSDFCIQQVYKMVQWDRREKVCGDDGQYFIELRPFEIATYQIKF